MKTLVSKTFSAIRNSMAHRTALMAARFSVINFRNNLTYKGTGTEMAIQETIDFPCHNIADWCIFLYDAKSIILATMNTGSAAMKALEAIDKAAKTISNEFHEKIASCDRKRGDDLIEACYLPNKIHF